MKRRKNTSKRCSSGMLCYLVGLYENGRPVVEHASWQDAARCEKKWDLYNDRPEVTNEAR